MKIKKKLEAAKTNSIILKQKGFWIGRAQKSEQQEIKLIKSTVSLNPQIAVHLKESFHCGLNIKTLGDLLKVRNIKSEEWKNVLFIVLANVFFTGFNTRSWKRYELSNTSENRQLKFLNLNQVKLLTLLKKNGFS